MSKSNFSKKKKKLKIKRIRNYSTKTIELTCALQIYPYCKKIKGKWSNHTTFPRLYTEEVVRKWVCILCRYYKQKRRGKMSNEQEKLLELSDTSNAIQKNNEVGLKSKDIRKLIEDFLASGKSQETISLRTPTYYSMITRVVKKIPKIKVSCKRYKHNRNKVSEITLKVIGGEE